MSESYESLRRLFSEAGYAFTEPPVVHEASVFVELAGEDLRRRLFLTSAPDGTELALRPDYTIPVCLAHLATGAARRRADYAYLGPVFRQRQGESGEFVQAGVESLGRSDRVAADADILKLALAATDLLGVSRPLVRIGDSALFASLLDALDLNQPWRRRLARAFGDPERLHMLVRRAAKGSRPGDQGDAPVNVDADRKAVRNAVEELLAETGMNTIAGRGAGEIAERFAEKAALATGIGDRAAKILQRFLRIAGRPDKALAALRALAASEKLDIGRAIDRFARSADAFAARDIDPRRLAFAADFGRRLDYYTGFVFEIHDRTRGDDRQIVGGGRYDRLLATILRQNDKRAGETVPAVGFAIWLDRIGGAP